MISVSQNVKSHKWRTYDRLAIDVTIILGQILRRYLVNWTSGSDVVL